MIPLKSQEDLDNLRISGKILARVLSQLQRSVKPGITTLDLDNLAAELISKEKVVSAFKGYNGFPANICTSVNDEVVHGIPGERVLKAGDIVSIDAGVIYKGLYTDAAVTVGVGKIDAKAKKLIEVAKDALFEGIKQFKEDNHITDISYAVENFVLKHGFSVVKQFVGHGIGKRLHEDPEIPNFGRPGLGEVIKTGMVFAIEPMINMGGWECEMLDNHWTAATEDGSLSAHYEHTVALTENGAEILTL